MKRFLIVLMTLLWAGGASSAVRIVTSLPDLADMARNIGGDRVTVDYIVQGNQNPHFVEVKPSYMMKLKKADLFMIVGMDLEMWAPQIIDGSRNSALKVVDLSRNIEKLEVPGRLDASQGDVHRYGNPHYWLDPRNARTVVEEMLTAMVEASPGDEQFFRANAAGFLRKVDGKIAEWEATMKPFAGRRIVTFHKSWGYFAKWLGIVVADQVEPKPGIQPSPGHTADLIRLVREGNIKAIVVEPFYDRSAAEQIARSTGAKVITLVTSVGGVGEAVDYLTMMDYNIRTLAEAFK